MESTKSVSDLYAPVTGEVTEVNDGVVADPALINSDPYGAGWLFKVAVTEEGPLMSAEEYAADKRRANSNSPWHSTLPSPNRPQLSS